MATVQITQCDSCNTRVDDRYINVGWIHLEITQFSVSTGRDEENVGTTKGIYSSKSLDFCCPACLIAFACDLAPDLYDTDNKFINEPTN